MDEVVQGYRCENEKCKHVSDKHRVQRFAYAPDVLLVQLKRFAYTGHKDSFQVNFGGTMDLSKHLVDPSLGPLKYELTAVVSHSGTSGFGHYICHAKGPGGGWTEFDDDHPYPSSMKEALRPGGTKGGWTPYLLFYQRVHDDQD